MRAVIASIVAALLPALSFAQDSLYFKGLGTPRFGVGMELLRPALRIADATGDIGVEVLFSYRVKEQRSWRVGYGFSRQEDYGGEYWRFNDPAVVQALSSGWYTRVHQVSLGHQWDLGKGRLRPFLGADAYIGYEEYGSYSSSRSFSWDSLQVGSGFGEPIAYESNWRYSESLRLGLGAALGLEYAPHRNLTVQLRASIAYFWNVPLVSENSSYGPGYRNRGFETPDVGPGLFVQFRF